MHTDLQYSLVIVKGHRYLSLTNILDQRKCSQENILLVQENYSHIWRFDYNEEATFSESSQLKFMFKHSLSNYLIQGIIILKWLY